MRQVRLLCVVFMSLKVVFMIPILFLQDAPVASKACLYLECAYFVNQCTQGNWPSWMQPYSNVSARSATFKRTVILQRTAAALFYRWAEVRLLALTKKNYESAGYSQNLE